MIKGRRCRHDQPISFVFWYIFLMIHKRIFCFLLPAESSVGGDDFVLKNKKIFSTFFSLLIDKQNWPKNHHRSCIFERVLHTFLNLSREKQKWIFYFDLRIVVFRFNPSNGWNVQHTHRHTRHTHSHTRTCWEGRILSLDIYFILALSAQEGKNKPSGLSLSQTPLQQWRPNFSFLFRIFSSLLLFSLFHSLKLFSKI